MVSEAGTGKEAIELLETQAYHIILLDVMLPDTDGWTLLRRLRRTSSVPVIMLTARGEEDDKLLGFDLGADDYMTKPFSVKELMARIKTVLNRHHVATYGEVLSIGALTVNTAFHQVCVDNQDVALTPLEYNLLMYFLDNRNIALSREQILNGVWGYDYYGDERTVDTHVKRLRQKLNGDTPLSGQTLSRGFSIKTIRGVGYRMVVEM